MSTSDQTEHGPLTRKQLREIRLTGSTPVITPEEAAAAAATTTPPLPPVPEAPTEDDSESTDTGGSAPADDRPVDLSSAPLTRRQARAQERVRTGSVPAVGSDEHDAEIADAEIVDPDTGQADVVADEPDQPVELAVVDDEQHTADEPVVAAVPDFSRASSVVDDDDDEGVDDVEVVAPVSASVAASSVGEVSLDVVDHDDASDPRDDVDALGLAPADDHDHDDVLADVDTDADDASEVADEGERPVVNPAFGVGLLRDPAESAKPFTPSFDELLTVGDSTGSQHVAPSALIFTPSPGEGSLSGPVASTGEILVTGSYELPRGMGSQGHAHGTTDGKEVDAVLIDGELPASSSPTPIAASSAVSTIKPAGEVIRPPAPEKGNKLMLILAITAGGLALALGVVLIFAFTTNVF